MQKLMLEIDGMGCGACVRKVTDALNAVPSVKVESVEIGGATLTLNPNQTGDAAVVEALAMSGYTARPTTANI